MQSKQDGLVPIGKPWPIWAGPVAALRDSGAVSSQDDKIVVGHRLEGQVASVNLLGERGSLVEVFFEERVVDSVRGSQ